MNMLLARIVMIATQVMSDFISINPVRNSAVMASPSFSGRDLNIFPLHRHHEPLHRIRAFFLEKTSLGDSSSARHERRMCRDTSILRDTVAVMNRERTSCCVEYESNFFASPLRCRIVNMA